MPSREDAWKAQYQKLTKFKEERGHTKVSRADNENLYIWCYTQRKKNRDAHSSLTNERIDQLDNLGFVWDIQSTLGRRKPMATDEIKKAKAAKKDKPTESKKKPPRAKSTKLNSLKTLPGEQDATASIAAAAAMADLDYIDYGADVTAVVAPVEPNKTFLRNSYAGAAWIGNGAKELLKMFVSF